MAIYFAFHFEELFGAFNGSTWAIVAIAAAAVFDFFDGAMARLLHAYSPVGGDLDSLSDLVSFGVAPAMLILNTMAMFGTPLGFCLGALIVPVCGAIRLAKFNNDTEQATFFRGLPIPAAAIFLIGVYGWCMRYGYPGWAVMLPVVALVSLTMVGRFKMFSLKFKNFDFAENFCRYLIVLAAIAFVLIYGLSGLMWTIVFYLLLSLARQSRI